MNCPNNDVDDTYREDDVVHVVEDFTANFQRHCQIGERFRTAVVIDDVSDHVSFQ